MVEFIIINENFINSIIYKTKKAIKNTTIKAVPLTETTIIHSKEGEEIGDKGDFLVIENNNAAANYIIKKERFVNMYEQIGENTYKKKTITLVYKVNTGLIITPSWNEGKPLISDDNGCYLMIYDDGEFNICSFEDFSKTYVFINN